MGIEQIIMPLLGGVATGMTKGFEVRRKEQLKQQERKDNALIQMIQKDPSVLDIPEIAAGAARIYGKNEVKAWAKAQRMKNAYDEYQTQELMQRNAPLAPGEWQALAPPGTQIPGMPPNTPGTAVDITGQSGGGSGNPLLGLISKILPALGGQAAGHTPQGAPQLPALPMAQASTGAPSGPQGYAPVAPVAAPQEVPAPGSDQAIAQAAVDKGLDAQVIGGPALTPTPTTSGTGGAPAQRILVQSAQQAAFSPKVKKMQLGDGVTVTKKMKNGLSISVTNEDPKWMDTDMAIAYRVLQDAGMEGDYNTAGNFAKILAIRQEVKNRGARATAFQSAAGRGEYEYDPDTMRATALLDGMKTEKRTQKELETKYEFETRPNVIQKRRRETREQKSDEMLGTAQGDLQRFVPEGEPIAVYPGSTGITIPEPPTTVGDVKTRREGKTTAATQQAHPLTAEEQTKETHYKNYLKSLAVIERILSKPGAEKYLGKFTGSETAYNTRAQWGDVPYVGHALTKVGEEEALLQQAFAEALAARTFLEKGSAASVKDREDVKAELMDFGVGNLKVVQAKTQAVKKKAEEDYQTFQQGIRQPRVQSGAAPAAAGFVNQVMFPPGVFPPKGADQLTILKMMTPEARATIRKMVQDGYLADGAILTPVQEQ
jgi:hypothetical protein